MPHRKQEALDHYSQRSMHPLARLCSSCAQCLRHPMYATTKPHNQRILNCHPGSVSQSATCHTAHLVSKVKGSEHDNSSNDSGHGRERCSAASADDARGSASRRVAASGRRGHGSGSAGQAGPGRTGTAGAVGCAAAVSAAAGNVAGTAGPGRRATDCGRCRGRRRVAAAAVDGAAATRLAATLDRGAVGAAGMRRNGAGRADAGAGAEGWRGRRRRFGWRLRLRRAANAGAPDARARYNARGRRWLAGRRRARLRERSWRRSGGSGPGRIVVGQPKG